MKKWGSEPRLWRLSSVALLSAGLFVAALLSFTAPAHAAQTVPYTVNFQGRLSDQNGNILANGSYNMKFRLWSAASGGSNLWEEDRLAGSTDNRVSVINGLFNVQLGSVQSLSPSLFSSGIYPLYLEVELPTPATAGCSTNGCASFTEGAMTPRQALASAPYAMNADTVDGIDGSSLVQLSPSQQQTGNINISGSIMSGSGIQASTASLTGNNALTLGSSSNAGALLFQDGTSNNRTITLNATALTASYALTLPSAPPSTSQCLQAGTITASSLAWGSCGSGSSLTIGSLDGGTASANGAAISGSTLYLQSATVSVPGLVTTTAQTLQGTKTFTSGVSINNSASTSTVPITIQTSTDTRSLGSELMTSSTSLTAAAGWTSISGTGQSATATHTAGISDTTPLTTSPAITLTAGQSYHLSFTMTGRTASYIKVYAGGTAVNSGFYSSSSSLDFTAPVTGSLNFVPYDATFDGTLTNISIKQYTGTLPATLQIMNASGSTVFELRVSNVASNTFLGTNAGRNAVSSSSANTATGYSSLYYNTTGTSNTASGSSSLYNNTTGSNNTASGTFSLQSNTTGSYNTATGSSSLYNNTTGFSNTATGTNSLYNLKTLSGSITATASNAGNAQFTTGSTSGLTAGLSLTISGTTSYNNTYTIASVDSSTTFTISASYSTADTAGSWTTGDPNSNTAVGYQAGTGSYSGYYATGNSLFGNQAGYSLQSGASYNTLIGYSAGSGVTTGANNLLLGYNAGQSLTTGSNNIILGSNINAPSATASYQLDIGNTLYGDMTSGQKNIAIGVNAFNGKLTVGGAVALQEITAPSATTGYGKLYVSSSDHTLHFVNSTGTDTAMGGGISISLGTYSTTNTDAHGATLSAGVLTFQDASTSAPGMVSTGTQTFAGTKTFTSGVSINNSASTSTVPITIQTSTDTRSLGSELMTSSTSLTAAAGWTSISGTGQSATATHTAGISDTTPLTTSPAITLTAGQSYHLSFTMTGRTASYIKVYAGGTAVSSSIYSSSSSLDFTAPVTGSLNFVPYDATFDGTLSNISIKQYSGTLPATLQIMNASGSTAFELRVGKTSGNTFLGAQSGQNNINGLYNTASGTFSLQSNTTGSYNTATGNSSLQSNTTGSYNTASGASSLSNNTTGTNNTATGYYALFSNTTGTNNTATGTNSLSNNTTGTNNTATGTNSLYNLKTLSGSITATASNAGNAQFTTGSTSGLTAGIAVTISGTTSYNSTYTIASVDSSTTFTISTAFVTADTAGSWTTANPNYNTAVGYQAGTGSYSGYYANGNSLFGYNTGNSLQSGASYNTIMGYSAGSSVTTGANNLLLGYNAGQNLTTGSNNIILGSNINAPSATVSNQLDIGDTLYGDMTSGQKNLAVGVNAFNGKLTVGGAVALQEITAPSGTSNYGKLYVSSSDHQLHFVNNSGTDAAVGGSLAVGSLDGGTANASGAIIASSVLYLQSASASFAGLVNTTTQTFAGNKTFNGSLVTGASAGSGTVFTNNGATVNTTGSLSLSSSGSIGTAATTVDVYTSLSVTATAAGLNFTIPAPTASTIYGRTVYLSNIGNNAFAIGGNGVTLNPGMSIGFVWQNTGTGASWQQMGGGTILNQSGSSQNASFNISGTGIAGTLQGGSHVYTPDLDVASAGILSIGNTNATTINLATNNANHTVNIGTGTGNQTIAIGIGSGTGSTTLQGGSGGVLINGSASATTPISFQVGGTTTASIDAQGRFTIQPANDSTGSDFAVWNAAHTTNVFNVDTTGINVNANANVNIANTFNLSLAGGGINIQGSGESTYTSPQGASIGTKINIANFDPGAYGQVMALGIATGQTSSRVLTLFDSRITQHQPTLTMFSPDEASIAGLNWNGSSSDFYLSNSNASGTVNLAYAATNGSTDTLLRAWANHDIRVGSTVSGIPTDNGSTFTIQDDVAPSSATGSGTAGKMSLNVLAQSGGATTGTTGQVGGAGGGVTIQGGTGGAAASGSTNGNGGSIYLYGGQAGGGAGTAGSGGSVIVKSLSNTTTAFQVQTSSSTSLLNVDTSTSTVTINGGAITTTNNGSGVIIGGGYSGSDTTAVGLTLDSSNTYAETANTCTSSANGGTMYFNTSTNAIRACIGGNWEDLVSTGGLGILTFGVVADSGGSTAGDLEALSSANVSGPCRASWASSTSVTVQPCTAYSGGRKVVVPAATTITLTGLASGNVYHICFNSAGTLAALTGTSDTNNLPAFSANNPVLCVADIKTSATAITQVYDTRVFTNSIKSFGYATTAAGLGYMMKMVTTDTTKIAPTSTTSDINIAGVVVSSGGTTWTSGNGPNVILATGGPTYVKATAGTTTAVEYAIGSTTTGYIGQTTTAPSTATSLGVIRSTYQSCGTPSATACQGSVYVEPRLR